MGKTNWDRQERRLSPMTCDYNGWNDVPEDEREWFDQHPEIWGSPSRESDVRPYRVTRQASGSKHRGGLAL